MICPRIPQRDSLHHASRVTRHVPRVTRHVPRVTRHVPRVTLLVLLAACCSAGDANLIPNGGFETPSETDPALPKGWTPHVHGKVTAAWADRGARSGKRCLRMTADPSEKWGHAYWSSAPIAVRPCMAYRVVFHFRAEGFGVPCFSLSKVKSWRLFKGGTGGTWRRHEDTVVVPPDVTATSFHVNNYHRAGKTMWLDDLSLVELPLAESPLTRRLARAKRSAAALDGSLSRLRLSLAQEEELAALRASLRQAQAAYARLEAGTATPKDFAAMDAGLEAVEKAIGAYLFTVWTIAPEDWERRAREPAAVSRAAEIALSVPVGTPTSCYLGVLGLIDDGLPVRLSVAGDRRAKDWDVRLLVAPAHGLRGSDGGREAWGELSSLGELFLPPAVPRFLRLDLAPGQAKAGTHTFRVAIDGLDRAAESGRVAVTVTLRRHQAAALIRGSTLLEAPSE